MLPDAVRAANTSQIGADGPRGSLDLPCSASRQVRHAGLAGQALQSILDGGRVAQGAVLAGAVVEADVVLKEPLPLLQRSWADPVPELLLDGALHPFHLAVEVGASGPDASVTDPQPLQETGQVVAELGAVVRLDATKGEGEAPEESWKDPADGSSGASLQDGSRQHGGAVVPQG